MAEAWEPVAVVAAEWAVAAVVWAVAAAVWAVVLRLVPAATAYARNVARLCPISWGRRVRR